MRAKKNAAAQAYKEPECTFKPVVNAKSSIIGKDIPIEKEPKGIDIINQRIIYRGDTKKDFDKEERVEPGRVNLVLDSIPEKHLVKSLR